MTTLFIITSSEGGYYPDPRNICVVAAKEQAESIVAVLNQGAATEKACNDRHRLMMNEWWKNNPGPSRTEYPNNDEYDALCIKWNEAYANNENKFWDENCKHSQEVLDMMDKFHIAPCTQYNLTYSVSEIEMVD